MYYNLKSDVENNLHARAGAWSNGVIVSSLFCILLFPLFKIETIVIAWEALGQKNCFPPRRYSYRLHYICIFNLFSHEKKEKIAFFKV